MIFITGDTHGIDDPNGIPVLNNFAKNNPHLTKNDYVIIAGDAGIVWSQQTIAERVSQYSALPYSILFVDGNHENFDMLDQYPVVMWNGGKVHMIADDIIHLMRGQIFSIEGKSILTFGGAESTDRGDRTEGKTWWQQESATIQQLYEAIDNLQKVDYVVDYIVTHTIDSATLRYPPMLRRIDRLGSTCKLLDYFQQNVSYKHWYFGHFHDDLVAGKNKTLIYTDIIQL